MNRGMQGRALTQRTPGETFQAFVPSSLPPVPPIQWSDSLSDLLEQANRALGRLDGVAMLLPDISLFLYIYLRKEAVLSSQIEGTQSSLSDLLLYESTEAPGVPLDDVREVSQYVAALEYGLSRIREGFPLSSRLLREAHGILLSEGRGSDRQPGEFRRSQNWIGGTRPGNAAFVPPPQEEVAGCISDLEKFIHDTERRTPTLVKAALTHVQFETIHPFLDGNGRIGRLLITLLLCQEGALNEPLLYLSYYLKRNRTRYYELLTLVRQTGDWESWLEFFLEGVRATAEQAALAARRTLQLFDRDRRALEGVGRSAGTALRVHHTMQRHPLISFGRLIDELALSYPAVTTAIANMERLGIVREISGRQRNRIFAYTEYLTILNEGTELEPPAAAPDTPTASRTAR